MTVKKISGYFIPSVADIIFVSIFLSLSMALGQNLLADGDTGYHIRVGEYIIDTLSVPKLDMYSYITPTMPWTAHEWLAEVIMAVLHRGFGMTGVIVVFSLLIALVYYLMMRQLRSLNGSILIAAAIVTLVIPASQIHWLARPHIFSLLMMVVWYRILDDYQYRGKDRLFWLPVMMLPWVNLHGGYLAGFILAGIYCAGNFLTSFGASTGDSAVSRGKSFKLFKISLLALFASLANPIGYKILLFPFKLTRDKYVMDHVQEFLPPNFHDPIFFKYLFLLSIGLLAFSRKRLNLIELMLLLLFTYMSLFSFRYVPLFALIIAPILLLRADDLFTSATGGIAGFLRQRADSFAATEALARGILWPVAACILASVVLAASNVEYSFDEKKKPVAAVEFLKKEQITGNMFNDDEFGDYLIYSVWPQYHVFIDGRLDMYGAERIKEYKKMREIETGWQEVVKKYDIDWIFFEAKSALSRFLLAAGGWRLIYADRVAHIFVKDIPKYQPLIKKYADVKPLPEEPDSDKQSEGGKINLKIF